MEEKHLRTGLKAMVIIIVVMWSSPALPEKVYIDINSPGFRPMPVAVVVVAPPVGETPCPDSKLVEGLVQVLSRDLEMSGYFSILPSDVFMLDGKEVSLYPEKIDFHAWSLIGTEILILLQMHCQGSEVSCEAQMLDVLTGKLLTWKRYKSDMSAFRRVPHRFANEVVAQLTGISGPFDTRIAYVSDAPGSKEIFVMDYDGHSPRRMTRLNSICLSPSWSPEGERLAFTSYWDRLPEVYVMALKTPSGMKRLLKGFSRLCSGASWSPDGKMMAFSASVGGNSEIFRVKTKGRKKPERLTRNWAIDVSPSWSPDGRQVVFVSDRAGHPDLYVLLLKEDKVRRLTFESSYNGDPEWSPQGDWIVYASKVEGRFQIFRIRPDGTQATQLTRGAGVSLNPSWSPDGRIVVFSSNRGGNFDLYLIRMDGTGRTRLTWSRHDETEPAWSPYLEP